MTVVRELVEGGVGAVMSGLDDLFTSDDEREQARLNELKQRMMPIIIAAQTSLEEARHSSVFVAGWRPAIGWVCASCLLWSWLVRDFMIAGLLIALTDVHTSTSVVEGLEVVKTMTTGEFVVSLLPDPGVAGQMTMVGTLLGMGGLRTYERMNGKERNNL